MQVNIKYHPEYERIKEAISAFKAAVSPVTGELEILYNPTENTDESKLYATIEETVLKVFGYESDIIEPNMQSRKSADCRHAICFLMMRYHPKGSAVLQTRLQRDRTSILYAISKINDLMSYENDIRDKILKCCEILDPVYAKH